MKKIKAARLLAGITQKQLADRYGIPLRTLQDYESDKRANTPPVYVENWFLRCMEVDYGVRLKDTADEGTTKTFTLTYSDGTPLTTVDEMYVRTERDAKRVELIKVEDGGVKTYKCSNGFIFKATLNQ